MLWIDTIDVTTIRVYNLTMKFIWDANKNSANIEKHGFDFSDAESVYENPHFIFEDTRQDYGEKRFTVIGWIKSRLVVLIYTKRNEYHRIISLRKANEREKKRFEDELETSR